MAKTSRSTGTKTPKKGAAARGVKTTKKAARKTPKKAARVRKRASGKQTEKTTKAKKKTPRRAARAATTGTPRETRRTATSAAASRNSPSKKAGEGSVRLVEGASSEAAQVRRRVPALGAGELDFFRRLLLEKRAELVGDVRTLHDEALRRRRQDATGDLSTMPIHMADLGTDNYEMELTLGLIEGERALLQEIDEALARIRDGTYGRCLATGKPIGKARLKAKPWARYCYEYTLAQEKGQAGKV